MRDTRYLNRFAVRLNGKPLHDLSVRALGPATVLIVGANSLVSIGKTGTGESEGIYEETVPPLIVAVEQHIRLTTDLQVRFVLQNFGRRTLPLNLSIEMGADLRDLFAIRGFPRLGPSGTFAPIAIDAHSVTFAYADAAGGTTMTVVHFDRPLTETASGGAGQTPEDQLDGRQNNDVVAGESAPPSPAVTVAFPMVLESGEAWELTVTISPNPPSRPPPLGSNARRPRRRSMPR